MAGIIMPAIRLCSAIIDDRMTMNEKKPWWAEQTLPVEPKTVSSAPGGKSIQRGVISVVSAFVAIVAAMVSFLVLGPNPELPHKDIFDSTAYPANTESLIAQCGDTYTYTPLPQYYGALPDNFFDDPAGGPDTINRTIPNHPMRVPAYGYFVNNEKINLKQKFYTQDDLKPRETPQGTIQGIQRIEYLKAMWDGKKIIWYMPTIDQITKDAIATFVDSRDDVIAIPWQDTASIPMRRNFAFSAWNVTRSCDLWDSEVANAFTDFADDYNKSRNIKDVPQATLRDDGELPLIDVPR
jgi:hypothetical protein